MSYLYPYGDTQQLNLSWFLAKFKELYEYIMNLDPDDIAITTVLSRFTNEYNSSTNYIPGDYVIHEGYIYKANQSTTGNFNPQAWDAALPVNDIQGLRILLGGITQDLTDLEENAVTNMQYTSGAADADGLLRQTKNGTAETVMTVDAEPTANSQNPVKSGAVYSELNELKGSLNTINTSLKKWDVKTNGKILFVGNSYAKDPNTAWTKWPDIAASTLSLGAEGGNWWNVGYPGYTLTSGQFLSQLQAWKTNNPGEVNNIGAVICIAGLNDSTANAYNNIPTAMQNMIEWINANLPNAKTYFGYTGFVNQAVNVHQHPSTDEYRFLALLNYTRCTEYGAIYLSGVENIIHDKNLLDSDGIHPNATGAKLLGEGVVNALLQGYAPYVGISGAIVPTIDSSLAGGSIVGSIHQFSENGIVSTDINLGLQLQSMATPPTWTGGQEYEIGTAVLPFTNGFESQDVVFAIYANGVGTVWGGGRLAIDKLTNKIKLRVSGFMSTTQSYDVLVLANIAINSAAPVYKDLYTTV